MMPWIKTSRRSGIGGLASQGAKPVDRCVLAKGHQYEADDKKLEGILQFHAFSGLDWII